jgi:biotin carboxyl carrier protein
MKYEVRLASPSSGEQIRVIELERDAESWVVTLDGRPVALDAAEIAPNILSILLEGHSFEISVTPSSNGKLKLQTGSQEFAAEVIDPRAWSGRRHSDVEAEGLQQIVAPMPGKVVRLLVKAGDHVEAGQGLLVVEAMKMQNEIRSPKSGTVERVLAKEGQPVNAGEVLAWIN